MSENYDVVQYLAGISAGSELAESRVIRQQATEHTQGSYQALFSRGSDDFPLALRTLIAAQVAAWHQLTALQQHYASLSPAAQPSAALTAALSFARRLTFEPVACGPDDIQHLQQAGWQTDTIVTLAQLIAFVSFQSRLISGFRLLADHQAPSAGEPNPLVCAGRWHTHPQTQQQQPAPVAFTQKTLGWEPWLAPKPLTEFTPQQQEILTGFGHQNSAYFRLLGRDLPVLEQRTLTDKGIFYTPGGLPRAERELAAAVTSKVNGCIYCASVHARKASQLSKKRDEVALLLQVQPGDPLSAGQSERWQAEIEAVAALSLTPPQLTATHLRTLSDLSLPVLEITDLIQSAAFFAWANRLMLTLGEPFILPQNAETAAR